MNSIEEIIKERINYFNNKEYEKIYDIYSINSEFKQFFPEIEVYREHFFKLIELFLPVSVEIYKVLYNNEWAEILFVENVRSLEDDVIITYYVKAFFQQENGQWKLQHEQRETAYKK